MAPVSSMNSDSNEKRAHALLNAVDFRAFDSLLSYKRSYPSICWKHQAGRASERLLSDASGLVCAWLAASQALYDVLHTHTYTLYLEEPFEHDVYDLVLLVDVVQLY